MKQSWRHQGNPSVLPGIQPEPQTSQSHPHYWRMKTLPRSFTPHQRGQKAQGSSLCSPQCRPCRLQKQSLKHWCILCPPHPATVTIAPIKSPLGSWPSECQIHRPRHRKSTVSWPLAQVPLHYEALNECCVQKSSDIFKGVSFQGLCWFWCCRHPFFVICSSLSSTTSSFSRSLCLLLSSSSSIFLYNNPFKVNMKLHSLPILLGSTWHFWVKR